MEGYTMNCSNCGKSNPDDARFCDGCGSNLAVTPPQNNFTSPPPPPPPPPAQNFQQQYQQPYQQPIGYAPVKDTSPLSMGQYIGMFILTAIPLVGFILLLVWAFGSDVNVNKKNYSRAVLILAIIGIVLTIIFSVVLGSLFSSIFSNGYYY